MRDGLNDTGESLNHGGLCVAKDLWDPTSWAQLFPDRSSLSDDLRLLERLFPLEWRIEALREPVSRHQLRGDLMTAGGRMRLLVLAAELGRIIGESSTAKIPVQGRLRYWRLYEPTKSELLVGPILRQVGDAIWQPAGTGYGADYALTTATGVYVAEVKRLCTSARQERIALERVVTDMQRSGPIFTPEEHMQNTREDGRRLYPHVRHAARQLEQSAGQARGQMRGRAASVPGMLFLDLDGNAYLGNVVEQLRGWMRLPWARSIDVILLFDYANRGGTWCTLADPVYSRSDRALATLAQALPICTRGHFHVGSPLTGPCEYPLPF